MRWKPEDRGGGKQLVEQKPWQDVLCRHKRPHGRSAGEISCAQCFHSSSPCPAVPLLAPTGGCIPSTRGSGSWWDGGGCSCSEG